MLMCHCTQQFDRQVSASVDTQCHQRAIAEINITKVRRVHARATVDLIDLTLPHLGLMNLLLQEVQSPDPSSMTPPALSY
jgi:hypothetical protein